MPIDQRILERIRANDPTLTEIHLSAQYPALTDTDITELVSAIQQSGNTQITSMLLYENAISDRGAKQLAKIKSLTTLVLNLNDIGDEGAKRLAGLPNLTDLGLAGNHIGDKGFQYLAGHPKLISLEANDNFISDAGVQGFLANNTITTLILDNNPISEGLLAQLNNHINANKFQRTPREQPTYFKSAPLSPKEPKISSNYQKIITMIEALPPDEQLKLKEELPNILKEPPAPSPK
jgi:hypothetical protein